MHVHHDTAMSLGMWELECAALNKCSQGLGQLVGIWGSLGGVA